MAFFTSSTTGFVGSTGSSFGSQDPSRPIINQALIQINFFMGVE
jgi:hypothetical protein